VHVERLEEFKSTLDRTNDAIFIFDPQTLSLLYANQGAVDYTGYAAADLLSRSWTDLQGTHRSAEVQRLLAALQQGPTRVSKFDTTWHRRDGAEFPVEVNLQFLAPSDQPARYIAVVRDITEKHRIDTMKSEFVSIVSHELRTPLTSIRGSLKLLESGVKAPLPTAALPLVKIASSNTERLIRLINDVLDVEKIEAGKLELHREELDLGTLIAATLEGLAGMAQQAGVALESDVPALTRLNGDRDRLTQVLVNLVSNAVKFSPRGERVVVSVSSVAHGRLRITVSDHGPGIPASQLHRLFGKFQQLDATDTRARGGTGLGLSIAKGIVSQHGGTIGVDSEPGVGSRFWFELPAVTVELAASATGDRAAS
jgi:PAS domain S-box-containing protein